MSEWSGTGLVYVGGELHQLLVPAGAVAQAVVEEGDGRAAGHHYIETMTEIFGQKQSFHLTQLILFLLSYLFVFSNTHEETPVNT